jgi:hypothetical protein
MLELVLTNGKTVKVLGLAAQHRALLADILHRQTRPPSPLSSTVRSATTPGQSDQPGTLRYNMDETG